MKALVNEHRHGFMMWLRTGFWPDPPDAQQIERKYNPWHDPDNGEFTFTGTGRHYGGGQGSGSRRYKPGKRSPLRVDVPYITPKTEKPVRGDGGPFGGGGASGTWDDTKPFPAPIPKRSGPSTQPLSGPATSTNLFPKVRKTVVRNGYKFEIDDFNRTIEVSGSVTENPRQQRSKESQAQAGGKDRRPTDEGGHYIARRFSGPTEYFNHFAQDANFNRSEYRQLENDWLREIRKGNRMPIRIVPKYRGLSKRPYELDVYFEKNGKQQSLKMKNESKRKVYGAR